MKNIAICYSEHAIKVSDSYCSGASNHAYSSPHLTPSIQNAVSSIYKVKLSSKQLLIRITWCRNLLNKGFSVGICDNSPFPTSKFSKNLGILRKERGTETFESGGLKIDVFWDLCRAMYNDSRPEPSTGFYVAILVNSEIGLILGDLEQELEIIKKRFSDARLCEFSLISRGEYFAGKGVYSTRAKFCENAAFHDVLIKCLGEDLYVYVDKKNVIEVKRLGWNFRGNQSIFVDGLLVDFMWNVHDWFFTSSGYAVFLFRTRKGLDSRLWLEQKNFEHNEQEKVGFSFLICACKNPD